MHLCDKSCTVEWLDVSMPHARRRRLKNHKQLKELEELDPGSEDVFMDNLVGNHYPDRPQNLEGVCLHDFVAKYTASGKDKSGHKTYRELQKPRLVNHYVFDPQKNEDREKYYYSLILLFVPFRDESDLLLAGETAEEAFNRLLPTNDNCSAYHSRLQKILALQATVKKIDEAREADVEDEQPEYEEDDDPQVEGEAKAAMQDVVDMHDNAADTITLEERVDMLNADQRRVFEKVKSHFLHQQLHEGNKCQCNLEPLRMFVSGVGGTGKSFLIETIKALVDQLWPCEDLTCAIAAPTGLAAFNVGGTTIHRLFQLPVEHEGTCAMYWSLSKTAQKVMKTTLRSVKVIIVDEVSMVSSLVFAYMHLRLNELFGGNDWFGSKNMLFMGDLLQLQPVNGSAVFERVTRKSLQYKLGCAATVNIWKDAVEYDELTINERQKQDQEFSSMLDCVRRGCPTDETLSTLEKRVIQVSTSEKFVELQKSGQTPVCLLPTRKACREFNEEMLASLDSKVHELPCVDEVDESGGTRRWNKKAADHLEKLNSDSNMTAGLEAKLRLAVGARVMLRRNIDTSAGLVNGAIGTIRAIAKRHVSVQFDHMTEPYNVEMVKCKFMVMKNFYVYRKQYPLILAYAVTIHKCQGLSLDCAIVDLSDKVFSAGMAYVALSRVRSLSGLHLIEFHSKSLMVSISCLKEVNRLREKYRPDLPLYAIPAPNKKATKRKLSGSNLCGDQPRPKKQRTATNTVSRKRKQTFDKSSEPPNKKAPSSNAGALGSDGDDGLVITGTGQIQYKYNPGDEQWQRNACSTLGLVYMGPNRVTPGGPDIDLKPPNRFKRIGGDGNCLFRTFSFILTGSEDQHMPVREAILDHMVRTAQLLLFQHIRSSHTSVQSYIASSEMKKFGIWGTETEILALAHMLQTDIYSYSTNDHKWHKYGIADVDRNESDDVTRTSIYIHHPQGHFEVVRSIRP